MPFKIYFFQARNNTNQQLSIGRIIPQIRGSFLTVHHWCVFLQSAETNLNRAYYAISAVHADNTCRDGPPGRSRSAPPDSRRGSRAVVVFLSAPGLVSFLKLLTRGFCTVVSFFVCIEIQGNNYWGWLSLMTRNQARCVSNTSDICSEKRDCLLAETKSLVFTLLHASYLNVFLHKQTSYGILICIFEHYKPYIIVAKKHFIVA